jgi:hypothetical protein
MTKTPPVRFFMLFRIPNRELFPDHQDEVVSHPPHTHNRITHHAKQHMNLISCLTIIRKQKTPELKVRGFHTTLT